MDTGRRKWLLRTGTLVLMAAAGVYGLRSCDAVPGSAAQAWDGPDDGEEDIRRWALGYAILAPSERNMQPWKVDLDTADDLIRVYMDKQQVLPATDPFARQAFLAMGGFIESLVIAASQQQYRADIEWFPEGNLALETLDAKPLADIRLVADDTVQADPLFEQLLKRRSNGQLYSSNPLSHEHQQALQMAMDKQGIEVDFVDRKQEVDTLRLLVTKAVAVEMTSPETMSEVIDYTRIGASSIDESRDGNALHGPLIWWLKNTGRLSAENAGTPGSMGYNAIFADATAAMLSTPGFVVFQNGGNSRQGQLAMGRGYLRFNLLATKLGVSVEPVNEVLADHEAMRETREAFYHALNKSPLRNAQLLVRIGYALEDVPPPTARRALEDILLKDEDKSS